jgi:hypothetical protein
VNTETAKAIVDEYVNYYANYWMAGLSVTQSALNVGKAEDLRRHIDKLAQAMEKELVAGSKSKRANRRRFASSLLLAHWEAQSYNGEQFVDLYDFCECLERRVGSSIIAKHCRSVKEFIGKEFVLKSCYCGPTYQYSYGVSIYFPWSQIAPSYWNLDFVNEKTRSGWGSFLKTYTELTRRAPRGLDAAKRADQVGKTAVAESLRNGMTEHRMIYNRMNQDDPKGYRMLYDRMVYDRMGAQNRVHSMRNPPDIFVPDDCIRDWQSAWEAQKTFRLR